MSGIIPKLKPKRCPQCGAMMMYDEKQEQHDCFECGWWE